jgi:hypothetical protein
MVFENRVLRRIFRPMRDEVTGEWSKLHNEELNITYSTSDFIRQIKSRTVRWAGAYDTHGREEKSVHGFGGEAQKKEATPKTEAYMVGWDQNQS